MKRLRWVLLAVIAVLVAFTLLWFRSSAVRWRGQIVARKLAGRVDDATWVELFRLMRPGAGYDLTKVITDDQSVTATLGNPFWYPEDRQRGAEIFRQRCSICHGMDAKGAEARGPSLVVAADFRDGASDWAIFKNVRDGIPRAGMPPSGLKERETWQVIAFVRQLQTEAERGGTGEEATESPRRKVNVSSADIVAAQNNEREWLTYSRTLNGWRFSPSSQINTSNVSRLRLLWVKQYETDEPKVETTPLVVDGVMYLTEPPASVLALDSRTGALLWRYTRDVPGKLPLCCGRVNRGVAIFGGSVFFATLDARLVALSASDGKPRWETQLANPADGYSITVAPLAVGENIVVGVAGGEYGIRGFLSAVEPATGKEKWRFWTVPGPGQPGHETWAGDSWRTGGAPTWTTGSYDPSLDLLYWGVGNPSPPFSGDDREGDNLYSNSVIALKGATGELAWHFQFTPHDERDWDSNQTPILTELVIKGSRRQVLCWANRNGFYYVLDRTTGDFLTGVPFVKQSWAQGLDGRGRPIEASGGRPTPAGAVITPGGAGGTNWQPPAFHPGLGRFFVHASESVGIISKLLPGRVRRAKGEVVMASGEVIRQYEPYVRALDAATGRREWEYRSPRSKGLSGTSGLLVTGGDLVSGGSDGTFFALDARSGRELWKIALGGGSWAPPITFELDGTQVIAVSAGRSIFLFGL